MAAFLLSENTYETNLDFVTDSNNSSSGCKRKMKL